MGFEFLWLTSTCNYSSRRFCVWYVSASALQGPSSHIHKPTPPYVKPPIYVTPPSLYHPQPVTHNICYSIHLPSAIPQHMPPTAPVSPSIYCPLVYITKIFKKHFCCCLTKDNLGGLRDGQQSRTLTVLLKVLSSNPSKHMEAQNYLKWDLMPSSGVSEVTYSVLMYNDK